MPDSPFCCGWVVDEEWYNRRCSTWAYPQSWASRRRPAEKPSWFSGLCAHCLPGSIHRGGGRILSVMGRVLPIIHRPYKVHGFLRNSFIINSVLGACV